MILRFKTEDNKEFVNINFSKECYNYGETPGRNYITVTERGYYDIIREMDFNCYGYSRSLETGDPADWHDFTPTELNGICIRCQHLYKLCSGTKNKVWTGCVWRDAPAEDLINFSERTRQAIEGTGKL